MNDYGLMFISASFKHLKIYVIVGIVIRYHTLIFQRTSENRIIGILRELQFKHLLENSLFYFFYLLIGHSFIFVHYIILTST